MTAHVRRPRGHGGGRRLALLPRPRAARSSPPLLDGVGPNALVLPGSWPASGRTSTLVLVFANLLPHRKHFHIITSIPNVFARNIEPHGPPAARWRRAPETIGEMVMKAAEEPDKAAPVGVSRIEDFTWKAILDFYTCTECGRCSDNCPAHKTGKILSPKQLTLDLRDHLYGRENEFLNRPGGRKGGRHGHAHGTTNGHGEHGRRPREGRGRRHGQTARTADARPATTTRPRRPRPPRAGAGRSRRVASKPVDLVGERHPPRRALGLHHLPRLRGAVPGDDQLRRQDRRACAATWCW